MASKDAVLNTEGNVEVMDMGRWREKNDAIFTSAVGVSTHR
jgi:hypothetical protein